ncbi:MAG: serine/threonine protein kinase [Magnetococcales bacterium]|nr:serine/threonine protein kinase [Magnetococcales bacterium]
MSDRVKEHHDTTTNQPPSQNDHSGSHPSGEQDFKLSIHVEEQEASAEEEDELSAMDERTMLESASSKKSEPPARPDFDLDNPVNRFIQSSITYELIDRIGQGGMGEVFKALFHTNIGTSETVAIKTVRSEIIKSFEKSRGADFLIDSFERETTILAELNGHPNIVGFKGADYIQKNEDTMLFLVMEYVNGFDLNGFRWLHRLHPEAILKGQAFHIPSEFIGFILFRVANGLDYANRFRFSNGRKGVVHLDLSPGNILINDTLGLVKLSDFGMAASLDDILVGGTGSMVGKPSYISPEMVHGNKITFTTDLYTLGIIIYELMTGLNPNQIEGTDHTKGFKKVRDKVVRIQERPLIPPHQVVRGIDERLSEIVVNLMQLDPEGRYNSSMELREIVGETIYGRGYGPTDGSFATYISKIRLSKYDFGRYKRLNDQLAQHYVDMVNAARKPIRLFPDARNKLLHGENPCRVRWGEKRSARLASVGKIRGGQSDLLKKTD